MEAKSELEILDQGKHDLYSALTVLYESVKNRKIHEILEEIKNVKVKNGKRKNI